MPLRNPFTRRLGQGVMVEERGTTTPTSSHLGFERVDTIGTKVSSTISIRSSHSGRSVDNGDYQLSVVNDSGVYLPPSPTDEKGLWPRQYTTTTSRSSTETKSTLGDIDHFRISRESFDSYRRSFDVTARSPVVHDTPTRASFDSARLPRIQRCDRRRRPFETAEPPTLEEFEDVGLDEKIPVSHPRRKGIWARFNTTASTTNSDVTPDHSASQMTVARWISGGRKRGNSMQGSELAPMAQAKPKINLTAEEEEGSKGGETQ